MFGWANLVGLGVLVGPILWSCVWLGQSCCGLLSGWANLVVVLGVGQSVVILACCDIGSWLSQSCEMGPILNVLLGCSLSVGWAHE